MFKNWKLETPHQKLCFGTGPVQHQSKARCWVGIQRQSKARCWVGNWKFQRGFTLIELLVVITVIGLLSAMVLVGLSGVRAQGRDTRRVADLRNTQNALEIYFNANNSYPTQADWTALETELVSADIGVKRLPRDPLSPRYEYEYAVDGSDLLHYALKATLESADNSALREDADGTLYGLDCGSPSDDRFYCIEL